MSALFRVRVSLMGILSFSRTAIAANDTIGLDNKKFFVRDNILFTLDNTKVANCIFDTNGYYNRLLITPVNDLSSLLETTKVEEYMPIEIEEHVSIAKKTGFLLNGLGCRECKYCYDRKNSLSSSATSTTVFFIPTLLIEYSFFKDGRPKRIFVTDTLIRDSRNVLQATEIEYGSCNDTLSTRQAVLRYDSVNYDLYWVVDGIVFKNEQVNKIARKQFYEDGIISKEEIYFMGRIVKKVRYPRVR